MAQANLLSLYEYRQAKTVALYAPVHNETDTDELLSEALQAGKQVLYPVVCGHTMVLRRVEHIENLQKGAFGIPEPAPGGVDYHADAADLIVIPGVAFDLSGNRIGYGKGYYDRFLQPPRIACLVGLCHDFQVLGVLPPADMHDVPMDVIITDKRIIHVKK